MTTALLGFTLDDARMQQIIAEDRAMPSQTHRFAWSLVEALEAAGEDPFLLSCAPVSSYPGNPHVVFHGGPFNARGRRGYELPFLNLTAVKHISRFLAAMTRGARILSLRGTDTLVVHGVHSAWLWFAAAMRRRGMTTVIVVTDPPGVVRPEDSRLVAALKRMDRHVVMASLRRQSGVVVLAPALADDYAPSVPSLLMEGVAPEPSADTTAGSGPATHLFRIVYAGGLSAEYGVKALVEAVRQLPLGNVELHTFGKGPLEDWIRSEAQLDPRILPPKLVFPEDVAAELDRANLLVQPRPISMSEARYSFPSKLLDYLSAGRPIITTGLPTLPTEYHEVVQVAEGDSSHELSQAILAVMAMPEGARQEMGCAARAFAADRKSAQAQAHRLGMFLSQLRSKNR